MAHVLFRACLKLYGCVVVRCVDTWVCGWWRCVCVWWVECVWWVVESKAWVMWRDKVSQVSEVVACANPPEAMCCEEWLVGNYGNTVTHVIDVIIHTNHHRNNYLWHL